MNTQPARHSAERRTEDRRRGQPWFRLDVAFMAGPKTVALGAQTGPLGPLAFIALMGAAKLQDEGGLVRMGWRQLAVGCYSPQTTDEEVAEIVGAMEECRMLEVRRQDRIGFTAQIHDWDDYQIGRAPAMTGAERTKKWRESKARCDENVTDVTPRDAARDDGDACDDYKDKDKDSVVPQQQQVAPAAAALHPAFADVMAIAQEACTAASKMLPPTDTAILSTLNAYPDGDHLQAAQLAKADVCAGLAKQPHFHRILGWKLADQAKAPPGHVSARDERRQRHADDLAAMERLMKEAGDALA